MELTTALGDTAVTSIQLKGNIDISNTLVVTKDVTLDLNGFVLKITGSGSVIKIESGTLTLVDSNPSAEHKFTNDGNDKPWRLDEPVPKRLKAGSLPAARGARINITMILAKLSIMIAAAACLWRRGQAL